MGLEHWLQLSLTDGIGPIFARRIIDATGSAAAACAASADLLATIEGIGVSRSRRMHQSLRESAGRVPEELERARLAGAVVLCPDDAEYPLLLHDIPDPPCVLYVMGNLEPRDLHAVSIVGSRKCSYYGREQAERFGALLAGAGITVISGGARGIDSAAHRGAMSHAMGRTIAVLGSGVDVTYPPENVSLFKQIAERGAVISEFPMGTEPAKQNFPRRNRVVSGMSRGVLVVEADERSGALITARQACDDHGRPVFALPGRVDNPLSAGPHALIRDGAVLCRGLDDILEGLHPLPDRAQHSQPAASIDPTLFAAPASPEPVADHGDVELAHLTDSQRAIIVAMDASPASTDEIVERTGLAVSIVLQSLTLLSLGGQVKRVDGQTFVRSR